MKAAPFDYHRPSTLPDALRLFERLENARLLAGGQSLIPMMNLRIATPDHLVDLGRIETIKGIEVLGEYVRVGAMTSQRSLERSVEVRRVCPILSEATTLVGHQQTRNRGTLGGSLCHLDPSAELPIVAAALEARLVIAGASGTRTLPFDEFAVGLLTNALAPGEILTHVEFPVLADGTGWAFEEFARRPADFAIVAVAVTVRCSPEAVVEELRLAVGGLGDAPTRLHAAEKLLAGKRWSEALVDEAARVAAEQPAVGDSDNTPEYRQHLAGVLTARALRKAYRRSTGEQRV